MIANIDHRLLERLQLEEAFLAEVESVASEIRSIIKPSFGPQGRFKLIINPAGDSYLTKKGKNIIRESNFLHPVATILEGLAKALDCECGDGVKTALMISCKLLENGIELIRRGIHPKIIIEGYKQALNKSYEILEYLSKRVGKREEDHLTKVAITELINGNLSESDAAKLSSCIVREVKRIYRDEHNLVDLNKIKTVKAKGAGEAAFTDGLIISERPYRVDAPKVVKNAKVAVLSSEIKIKKVSNSKKSVISSDPEFSKEYESWKRNKLYVVFEKITDTGANVVVCGGDIDPVVEFLLTKNNVYVLKKIKKRDLELISQVTGAKITVVEDLRPEDLGFAERVELIKISDEYMTLVRGCEEEISTLVIKGSSKQTTDRIEEAVNSAINSVAFVLAYSKVVPGGGATETEIALALREYATTLDDKKSLAVDAAADAFKEVPKTLAENSGRDALEVLSDLMSAHVKGKIFAHIDVNGKLNTDEDVIEPFYVKAQAVVSAFEVAHLLLNVDAIALKK